MSEKQVIRHCAPTLAGLKSGSMFSCKVESREALLCEVGRLNRLLSAKGVRCKILRLSGERALIYLYRKTQLAAALSHGVSRALLDARGYPVDHPEACVIRLADKIRSSADFPHEIGLFLGYPPEDVVGFIEQGPRSCKSVGYWRVYGDEEAARRRFAQFQKCSVAYAALFASGKTIERLTVTR